MFGDRALGNLPNDIEKSAVMGTTSLAHEEEPQKTTA